MERSEQTAERPTTGPEDVLPGEAQVYAAAQRALGRRRGLRGLWPFLGPAFIASVAYVDPGNFATNIAGGSKFGYRLVWVVVGANLMAMLIQTLSAKLGVATGKNLPELCRERFSAPARYLLWVQAELVAMATDLAELVGAALGINLLFGIPLFAAGLLTGVAAYAVLALQSRGVRTLEAVIAAFVGVILVAFALEVFLAHPNSTSVVAGLVPRFSGRESVLLAAGILGATVMPHVVYLHSALTQRRVVAQDEAERKAVFRFELVDVVIAMLIAGAINLSMLVLAAAALHGSGISGLAQVSAVLGHQLGAHANVFFGVALLASGLSSSSVGTMAGQIVMQGFLDRRVPLSLRRLLTMLPALAVLAFGLDASRALVLSQVVLSFGIPFALVPLVYFCSRPELMGGLVSRRATTVAASAIVLVVVALNVFLLARLALG